MTVTEHLQKALLQFGPNGEYWVNHYPDKKKQFCAISALSIGEPGAEDNTAYTALSNSLLIGTGGLVHIFNDDPGTRFPDIKALYERAIKSLEGK